MVCEISINVDSGKGFAAAFYRRVHCAFGMCFHKAFGRFGGQGNHVIQDFENRKGQLIPGMSSDAVQRHIILASDAIS